MRSESRRSLSSGTACEISLKRSGPPSPSSSTATMAPVQRRPMSSTAAWEQGKQAGALSPGAVLDPRASPVARAWRLMARKRSAAGSGRSCGPQAPRVLPRSVDGYLAGDVHHRREGLERRGGDRLQDLLVAPAGLARLLVEVHRRLGLALDEGLEVAQERRLALVAGVPLAGQRDLVEREPGLPRRAAVHRRAGLGVVVLGDRQRDPLERRQRERAVAQLRAEPRVRPQRGRRAGEHAEEVRELAAGGERPAKDGDGALRGGELVVDVEATHRGLHQLSAFCEEEWRPCRNAGPAYRADTSLRTVSLRRCISRGNGLTRRIGQTRRRIGAEADTWRPRLPAPRGVAPERPVCRPARARCAPTPQVRVSGRPSSLLQVRLAHSGLLSRRRAGAERLSARAPQRAGARSATAAPAWP